MNNLPLGEEHVISVDCEAGLGVGATKPCGFSGEVDASSIDRETWQFTCPECRVEGEWIIYQEEDL